MQPCVTMDYSVSLCLVADKQAAIAVIAIAVLLLSTSVVYRLYIGRHREPTHRKLERAVATGGETSPEQHDREMRQEAAEFVVRKLVYVQLRISGHPRA